MARATIDMKQNYMSGYDIVVGITTEVTPLTYRLLDGNEVVFIGVVSSVSGRVGLNLKDLLCSFLKSNEPCKSLVFECLWNDTLLASHIFALYNGSAPLLLSNGENLLEDYLLRNDKNFLHTVRSRGRLITIPENEITPLKCYGKDLEFSVFVGTREVDFVSNTGLAENAPDFYEEINLFDLRANHFAITNEIANVFDVCSLNRTEIYFTVVITKAKPTRFKLRFRNQFNAYELLALDDYMEFEVETKSAEASAYNISESKRLLFDYNKKSKIRAKTSISDRNDALPLIAAAMASDDVHLVYSDKEEFPVVISAPIGSKTKTEVSRINIEIDFKNSYNFSLYDRDTSLSLFNKVFNQIYS